MRRKSYYVVALCMLGFLLGTSYAWIDATTEDGAARFNNIEPATGYTEIAGSDALGGAFTLTDHNGMPVTNKTYSEQYKLVFFGFTYCPDVCPAGLQKMTQALDILGTQADSIQPLFISVDPSRDTPDVLEAYVSQFHDNLIGLTGTQEQITDVQDKYKVFASKFEDAESPDGYTMNHSAFTFLMSPDDQLLGLYSSTESPSDIANDIKKILNQS